MTDLFIEKDAVISDCGRYRYLLRRAWDHKAPRALFVMLNPSTADAEVDDQTIRSCRRLTDSWGFGSFEVVNLFGWRSTEPDALLGMGLEEAVGPDNARISDAAIDRCDIVILAWGAHPVASNRARDVVTWAKGCKPTVYCLGKTKGGSPKHPLYIKTGTRLESYP